ncbi:peptidylprolyl isomerase [Chloroflexota bacterium]
MPKSKKKRAAKKKLEQAPGSKVTASSRTGRRTGFILAAVVILLILVIIGVSVYPTYIAPFRHVVVTVDDTEIRMDYFLRLCKTTGNTPMGALDTVSHHQILRQEAPKYVGEVTEEDIEQELRRLAMGSSGNMSESEFKEWYRQSLNNSPMSETEYRDLVAVSILASRFGEYLAESVSTVAEQIHLYAIFTDSYENAEEARVRWETGEDFSDLAREVSLDGESAEKGGELGWFPRGALDRAWEARAFALGTDNVSAPVPMYTETQDETGETVQELTGFHLLYVPEIDEAREVGEEALQIIKDNSLEEWLWAETSNHEIKYYGLYAKGFDSKTAAWIIWQLESE